MLCSLDAATPSLLGTGSGAPASSTTSSSIIADYRRPYAVFAYLGLLATVAMFYGLGYLIAVIARHEGSRWWTYPCLMLITLGIMRFHKPEAQHDTLSAALPV
jgi:hypothetical protein